MKANKKTIFVIVILLLVLSLVSCQTAVQNDNTDTAAADYSDYSNDSYELNDAEYGSDSSDTADISESNGYYIENSDTVSPEYPEYDGSPYCAVNDNIPYFTPDEIEDTSFEYYSDLDSLGRCGVCVASVSTDIMPVEERGEIGQIKPSGWQSVKYDIVDGKYLYNRCHLIGFQLTGENANEKNLITGTRYMNIEGMLPFENMTADYIKETGNHVMYRVTPVFQDDNLVADGVLMEALSVEDDGEGISFCVFCYNVQPGIYIDYKTGDSCEAEGYDEYEKSSSDDETGTYILNTNTHKFHRPDCSSVSDMKESNREEYTGSRSSLIEKGYEPCGRCNP